MMTETLTQRASASQQRASDPGASAWVSANAGSGKTHVLANRVIRLLLEGTDPQRILCLTFTRAAAAEMSNRIFSTLGQWVSLDDETLMERIQDISGHVPIEARQLAGARRLFAQALETPGGLKVQTIHAFCESLLQRFPVEAQIPQGFQVLDERDGSQLLSSARAEVLSAASEPGADLHKALQSVVARLQPADFDTVLNELLSRRRGVSGQDSPEAIVEGLRRLHGLHDFESVESIIAATLPPDDELEIYKSAALELAQSSANDQKLAAKIEAALAATGAEARYLALRAVFFTKALTPVKTLTTKGFATDHPILAEHLAQAQLEFTASYERYKAACVCEGTQALIAIADTVIARFETEKRLRSLLDYDDLVNHTLDLFTSSSSAWVLYKLDGGLDHILVDEAQDTSPEQWRVIQHLSEEFFAGQGARDVVRTIFAVGDEKQSIFSFQGADPAEFEEMRRYFAGHVEQAQAPFETVPLTVSFRSTPTVLKAVDLVFEQPEAANGLTQAGSPSPHQANRMGQPGLVEVWPTLKPDETEEEDPWDAPVDRESPGSPRARLAEMIAETISGWRRDGEILASKNRPIEPGDILILVRRRDAFADAMVRELKRRNIPVAGADRLTLTEHIAVMDLIALTQFVLLPGDDLALATILKSPLFVRSNGRPFDDDTLFQLAYDRSGSLWSALLQHRGDPDIAAAAERLAEWRGRADWQKPYEFYAQILGGRDDSARRRFVERLGTEANDPIDEFLNRALQYERANVPSLQGFLEWMTAADTQIKRDMDHGTNEVRVMTVHGAKGLEANVVFLPDTCSAPSHLHDPKILSLADPDIADTAYPVWPIAKAFETPPVAEARDHLRSQQREEYNRLLYVAMTRACDRLYVTGYETKRGREAHCWYNLVRNALEPHAVEIGEDEDEAARLRFEEPGRSPPEADRDAHEARPGAASPPDWARTPPPASPPGLRTLAPSRLDIDTDDQTGASITLNEQPVLSPLAGSQADRFRRGQLIHSLLQSLPDVAADDRRARAHGFLDVAASDLGPEAVAEIAEAALGVLDDPEFSSLFGPDSRAEVPIVGRLPVRQASGEEVVISGQVDRLVVSGDEVLIVDYKTNRPAPPDLDGVAPLYIRQIAAYRIALQILFPGKTVRGLLLWTDGPKLMEIPVRRLDAALPVSHDNGPGC